MSKAKKRGNVWRVQVYDYTDENGKKHIRSFSASTKVRAEFLAAEFKQERKAHKRAPGDPTVGEAIDRYIELKALLSPTTLNAYRTMREYAFQDLMNVRVSLLDDEMMQAAINTEAKRKIRQTGKVISPKSVKNEYALLSAALKEICHREFWVTLPKVQRHIKDYPDPVDVLSAIIGSDIELPCLLAMWLSFSMSEIRGLMCSDIKDGYITINRVLVDVKGGPVIKENAKVETRLRKHKIPEYILSLINTTETYIIFAETGKNGPLIAYDRSQIYGRWRSLCKTYGLELSFHDLRHMNASIMDYLNFPTKLAQERGGWKTDHVMKSVYTHTFSEERERYDGLIDSYFENEITRSITTKSENR